MAWYASFESPRGPAVSRLAHVARAHRCSLSNRVAGESTAIVFSVTLPRAPLSQMGRLLPTLRRGSSLIRDDSPGACSTEEKKAPYNP